MSYMRAGQSNGVPSYMNGVAGSRLQRFDFDTTPENSADERSLSRGGPPASSGYGARPQQQSAQVRGLPRVERQHAYRRSRAFDDSSTSRSRSRPGWRRSGGAATSTDDVLRHIERQWSFMADDSCVPVKVALQLMDSSSLGLAEQYDQFQEVYEQLQSALKVIVNEHHQGFNSSIGTYHKIQAAIHASQFRVRALRTDLLQAKTSLATTRPELKAFSTSSQTYDQMLQILGSIETLRNIPDYLEVQISEKRFLGAVATLQEALALIRKPEMEDIGALSDLKVYLSNQEHSLTDILIEELHSHLYLKSPYCEERWKAHLHRHAAGGTVAREAATVSEEERAVHLFLENYDGTHLMQEDPVRNPEAGTFYYIQLLVESLNQMGKLETAIDAIEQRLPVELFRVVERTNNEVEQRHPQSQMRATLSRARQNLEGAKAQQPDNERQATLDDLLTTLYAKFEAIAEGHRVFHDVTAAILRREAHEDASTVNRGFRELWKLLQSEIRSLLHDHLASAGTAAGQSNRNANETSANMFRAQPRDRTRKLFKLTDTDSLANEIATERDDLEYILKASVPGLVNSQKAQQARQQDETADQALSERSSAGHKLLVEPSVFNMGILLAPSLIFLNRLKEIVPQESGVVASTLTSFLDDFLVNVFYPQLEETLMDLCSRCMGEADAFQVDSMSNQSLSARPIFKGTAKFFELIQAFCSMLDALPHEQSFSALVIDQVQRYYDKCYQWSKALLQRTHAQDDHAAAKLRLAADLANGSDINDVVDQLLTRHAWTVEGKGPEWTDSQETLLTEKEAGLLVNMAKNHRLQEADLIHDRKALAALGTMHASAKWLAARCRSLRYISPRAVDMANMQAHQTRRWTTNANLISAPSGPYLPLDPLTVTQFDAVLVSFTELSMLVLRILHIDLRLHLLHGIYTALDTTYALGQPYNDPDAAILALSTTLGAYDTMLTTHLLPAQYSFIANNMDVLVNDAMCRLVSTVPAMDDHGIARMALNLLVLQQSLKNIQPDASLERAQRFYDMAARGAAEIVTEEAMEGYDDGDLKALLRLCWNPARDGALGSLDDAIARLG